MRTIFILLWLVGFVMLVTGICLLHLFVTLPALVGGLVLITLGLLIMFGSWIVLEAQSAGL